MQLCYRRVRSVFLALVEFLPLCEGTEVTSSIRNLGFNGGWVIDVILNPQLQLEPIFFGSGVIPGMARTEYGVSLVCPLWTG